MRAVIIHIRCQAGKSDARNPLIFMLENLFSELGIWEKKHILSKECGMTMTVELEGRIYAMCNFSEAIIERSIEQERINAIERMIKAGATKVQMLSYVYTEDELKKAESALCV